MEQKRNIKKELGRYIKWFDLKPRAKVKEDVTAKAPLVAAVINCGMRCSQYTLRTRFGWSMLEEMDKIKDTALYYLGNETFMYGRIDSFTEGDEVGLVDNDNYNKSYGWKYTVKKVIRSRSDYEEFLQMQGYQVHPPKAFIRAKGKVSSGFTLYSIKGVCDTSKILYNIFNLAQ